MKSETCRLKSLCPTLICVKEVTVTKIVRTFRTFGKNPPLPMKRFAKCAKFIVKHETICKSGIKVTFRAHFFQ